MKYYLLEIAEGDSKIAGPGVYTYEDLTSAIAAFHKKMGTAMGSELYTADLILVVDENGAISKIEKFTRETSDDAE